MKILAFSRAKPIVVMPAIDTMKTPRPVARLYQVRPTVRAASTTVATTHATSTGRTMCVAVAELKPDSGAPRMSAELGGYP